MFRISVRHIKKKIQMDQIKVRDELRVTNRQKLEYDITKERITDETKGWLNGAQRITSVVEDNQAENGEPRYWSSPIMIW